MFQKFKQTQYTNLFQWLNDNKLLKHSINDFQKIYDLFMIDAHDLNEQYLIIENKINNSQLRIILEKNNFIFPTY